MMIVYTNTENISKTEHVEFVNYTGSFPNLCRGVLTLKIDGEIVKFGHDYKDYCLKTSKFNDSNYDSFWQSGGWIDEEYRTRSGEWEIYLNKLPEQYRQYAREIDVVFNSCVRHGCCGGCS